MVTSCWRPSWRSTILCNRKSSAIQAQPRFLTPQNAPISAKAQHSLVCSQPESDSRKSVSYIRVTIKPLQNIVCLSDQHLILTLPLHSQAFRPYTSMSRHQVIIVMGVTGVGKSTFIRHATGLDVKVGHRQNACEYSRASVLTWTNCRHRHGDCQIL